MTSAADDINGCDKKANGCYVSRLL